MIVRMSKVPYQNKCSKNLHYKQVFAKLRNQVLPDSCTHMLTYMQLMPEWEEKVLGGNFSCMVNEVPPSSTPTAASLGIIDEYCRSGNFHVKKEFA